MCDGGAAATRLVVALGFCLATGGKCMPVGAYVQPMQHGEVCGALLSTAQRHLAGVTGTFVGVYGWHGGPVCCCEECC